MSSSGPLIFRVMRLPTAVKEYHLINYFSKYGQVEKVHIPRTPNKDHKGFGFVVISEESAYKRILEEREHVQLGVNVHVLPPPDYKVLLPNPLPSPAQIKREKFIFTSIVGKRTRQMRAVSPRSIDFHGFEGWFEKNATVPSIPKLHTLTPLPDEIELFNRNVEQEMQAEQNTENKEAAPQ